MVDKYTLSYVNLPETEIRVDMQSDTIILLMAFVNNSFPTATNY